MSPRPLSAGHLRHRVTIQTPTLSDDGRGGKTSSWGTHATLWARVTPVSAREAFAAGQMQGAITHRVVSRYATGLSTKMRIVWGSRTFLITGWRNIEEDRRILQIDCVEERV